MKINYFIKLGESFSGVHKSELITWYLGEVESQIENEQQLNEQTVLIEKILHRLINYVRFLREMLIFLIML